MGIGKPVEKVTTVADERRRYRRYETRLRGRLGIAGGPQHSCLIRDYCSGGMLVQYLVEGADTEPPVLAVGQPVQLNTELLVANGSMPLRVGATIAWIRGEHLGLSFPELSDAVVEALRRHDELSRSDAVVVADSAQGGGEARCYAKLRHVAQGVLPAMMRELLLATGRDLLDRADKVSSNTEQQQLFGDMNAIETLSRGDALAKAVLDIALDPAAATEARHEPPDRELSLIDPVEFERWLEASRVATQLDRRFSVQLNAIGARLAGLRTVGNEASLSVPFEPQHFTLAIKEMAKQYELGVLSRAVLFDRAVVVLRDSLEGFYAEISAALDALGIAPARITLRAAPRAAEPALGGPARPGPPSDIPTASDPPSARSGAGTPGVVLPQEAQQREHLAQELMSFVTDVPNMTESLATWLQQLGEPLVREAVSDRTFFQNPQHPLREIVDGLGHLQMFRPSPDSPDDPLRRRVTELLEPLSSGDIDGVDVRAIAESLGRLTGEESRRYQRNVERVAEIHEGRDRVRRARVAVRDEINRRYAGRQVPEVVPELLDVGWRAVLELALINSTDDQGRFTYCWQLLDQLVAVLGGESHELQADDTDRRQLLEAIERELVTVAFDPFRRNAVETRLRRELLDPTRGPARLVEMPARGEEGNRVSSAQRPNGIAESAWERVLEICAAIVVGDQLLLHDGDDGQRDLRVAWIRSDREVFALVDYRGLRAREISLGKLAVGLHQRRIEIKSVDGQPLSDRGVDAILRRMEERLAYQAAHDSLTGLINRQQFNAAVGMALTVPDRSANTGALLLIDVDLFRLVNDMHDYDTGDRLLVSLARLLEQVPGAKVLGHLGGDRFAVLLPDITLADAERRARGICAAVAAMSFESGRQAIATSVSIGVAGLLTAEERISRLMQAADNALSVAKAAGGNRCHVYHDDDPDIARRQESVHWVAQVDEALDRGHLRLRCQPIVPIATDAGLEPHYEVLLGVNSGSAEPLPIAEFIDAAERYNRMRAVDRWVAKTVMEWIAAHREHMPVLHGFAVNLSGQTASDPSFVDFVRKQFQVTGALPQWLSFEVTETAAVSDLSRSAGIIHDLKALGCSVALDDFGSGLASYSYLKELPVDWLKIDGAFVRKIVADEQDYAVVKSINEIGHFLGKKTIAEYVADDEILRRVREIGVDYAQGFGISPPLLMDDLLQSLAVPVSKAAG